MKITEAVFGRSLQTKSTVSNILFIDPGIRGTGYAFWSCLNTGRAVPPDTCGTIQRQAGETWQDSAFSMIERITEDGMFARSGTLVIEWPALWAGSAKSHAAVSSGNLLKLVSFIGMMSYAWMDVGAPRPILIEPKDWKGQMSKPAIKARIKRALDMSIKSHAADAVGMGLAAAGVL